jgi:ubiquinone/menaquinone biosynthesis C-methylase UbiE
METELERLKQTWQVLGRDDPLWAIASVEGKRSGKWDVAEFLAAGERDVEQFAALLKRHAAVPDCFAHVLDFGCGVGRLARGWARRASQVTGVDISAPMIERGRAMMADMPNIRLVVNEAEDLACFQSNTFDVVFSHVCLQHIPWDLAAGYLREFARVCAPGGWVVFDLPSRRLSASWGPALRQRMVEGLPFGLSRVYRRWRHGTEAIFDMHFTPPEAVAATVSAAGLSLVHRELDHSAGATVEGYVYIFAKPSATRQSR